MQEQFLNASMAALRGSVRDGANIFNGKDLPERQYAVFTLIADPDHSDEEDRFILPGTSIHSRVLVVCHCVRDGETIRIISARKADKARAQDL